MRRRRLTACNTNPDDPFRQLIPRYDLILTYGGGAPVISAYRSARGAAVRADLQRVDPTTHHPVAADPRFAADLSFLGNRLPDREARVDEFFLRAAAALPEQRFVLGGSGWRDKPLPANVTLCRPRLHARPQRLQLHAARGAERQSRKHGELRLLAGDARVRGRRRGRVPDHRCLRRRRSILRAGRGDPRRAADGDEVARAHAAHLTPDRARRDRAGRTATRRLAEHTVRSPGRAARKRSCGDVTDVADTQMASLILGRARPWRIVIIGLSITSSWGNGHATTYRGLVRELTRRGHDVLFLEHDKPWYAANRDLPTPPFGRTRAVSTAATSCRSASPTRCAMPIWSSSARTCREGVEVGEWVTRSRSGVTAFYDIDTPVTLAKLERGDREYLSRRTDPQGTTSTSRSPAVRRSSGSSGTFGSPRARAAVLFGRSELYYPQTATEPRQWDLGYLGTYSADRQPPLRAAAARRRGRRPQRQFVVAGPQYPASIALAGERAAHRASVAPAQHRAFYNSQRFTLNLTRADMVQAGYSPSVRLFEAAACGVADHQRLVGGAG